MRQTVSLLFLIIFGAAVAQQDIYSLRYSYTFVEDSAVLLPLQGMYRVEYLARGQWWTYTDPRTPVDHAGRPMGLKPLMEVNGSTVMAVEVEREMFTTDNKLRAVRGVDTMIVDLAGNSRLEDLMRERTDRVGPPRPPVLLPFRKGWYDLSLLDHARNLLLTGQFDSLWTVHRVVVLACYDTLRSELPWTVLEQEQLAPLEVPVDRNANYRTHLLHFPANDDPVHYSLFRQDAQGAAEETESLQVQAPADTGRWVDISTLRPGRYTTHVQQGAARSVVHITITW